MSWLDFIGNIGTNIKEGVGNVANKIRYANAPQIQPLQMAENGGIDAQKTLELALAQPKTLGERLGGRTVNVDFESSNPETGEIEVNRISKTGSIIETVVSSASTVKAGHEYLEISGTI